ncbi:hypothetical protein AVEN_58560-1 [Araneus ventricosus]|uniref:Uncharacterized protein n=1 Tax=Araneus ventricosus TaxID=182803 RepID=A0A4Y2CPE0_ARAVE|nr:hypothetical protein AVEN_58560-1 [Araneus ventricosus]
MLSFCYSEESKSIMQFLLNIWITPQTMLAITTMTKAFKSVMADGRGGSTLITCNYINGLIAQLTEKCELGHIYTQITIRVTSLCGYSNNIVCACPTTITDLKAFKTLAIAASIETRRTMFEENCIHAG